MGNLPEKNTNPLYKREEPLEKQVLTLQRMKEIEKVVLAKQKEEEKILEIRKLKEVAISKTRGLQNVYLAQMQNGDNIYFDLYDTSGEKIGTTNSDGMLELDEEYLEEIERQMQEKGIDPVVEERLPLDPNQLVKNAEERKDPSLSQLEQDEDVKKRYEQEQEEQENTATINKMEEDLGVHIVALTKIEDENFSENVIGHQIGADSYVALTDTNEFILVEDRGTFKKNEAFTSATRATPDEQKEYDENGNLVNNPDIDYVLRRKDGTTSGLAIDMQYGAICLYDRSDPEKSEEITTSTCKPTKAEVENEKTEKVEIEKKEESKEEIEEETKEQKKEDPYYDSWVEDQKRKGYM